MSKPVDLDAAIARYNRRAEIIKMLQGALCDDPEFARELATIITSAPTPTATKPRRLRLDEPGRRVSHFERLAEWFGSRGNAWAAIDQMAAVTGATENSVRQLLYRGKPEAFERQKDRVQNRTLWRLRECEGEKGDNGQ